MDIKNLIYLTYKSGTKYYLKYGTDAEWSCFSSYDILDNAIQRLGKYEEIKLKREREDIGYCNRECGKYRHHYLVWIA